MCVVVHWLTLLGSLCTYITNKQTGCQRVGGNPTAPRVSGGWRRVQSDQCAGHGHGQRRILCRRSQNCLDHEKISGRLGTDPALQSHTPQALHHVHSTTDWANQHVFRNSHVQCVQLASALSAGGRQHGGIHAVPMGAVCDTEQFVCLPIVVEKDVKRNTIEYSSNHC